MRLLALLVLSVALTAHPPSLLAENPPMLDCPLRDAPFSLSTPLVDVLISPAARAVLERHLGAVLERLPPQMTATEPPTFAAILDVARLAAMAGIPQEALAALDEALAQVPVTDADRRARCARYDDERPTFELPDDRPAVLDFHKINGFHHGPAVAAASEAVAALAEELGLAVAATDRGGAIHPEVLARFRLVVWNNVSGDVLTLSQRRALEDWVKGGGGFLALHGSGGDPVVFWDFYARELIGARFLGHPMDPQFQAAWVRIEPSRSGVGARLAPGFTLVDEWYSFVDNPRAGGADVVATLDEGSYRPVGHGGQDLRMGDDHPIVWARCVGRGRALYSAIGHRPEVYRNPEYLFLLRDALAWAAGLKRSFCSE
ncbi:MAG: hypothetical protein KatS3mg124_1763 [Porticoccaceae bacterium]|nr:MAG: hypothetical protein KatS3mg124_1763 [Porticoccaceae bacterium]